MWAGRRFSSLFSSLSPPSLPSSSSSIADCRQSSMTLSPPSTISSSRRRLSSSSSSSLSSSSSSKSSSLLSSSSLSSSRSSLSSSWSSWMLYAIVVVVVLLGTQTFQTVAVDPLLGAGAGGNVVARRQNKGADFGNSRLEIKDSPLEKKVEGLKSVLKKPREIKDAVKSGKTLDEHINDNVARNYKEQTFRGTIKKDTLLKQLQDHEEENNLKEQEIRKREMVRHQRQQKADDQQRQQLLQQQSKVDAADAAKRARKEEKDQEQKWLVDMQRKVVDTAARQRQNQEDMNKPVDFRDNLKTIAKDTSNINNNNNNNRVDRSLVKNPVINQNNNNNNNVPEFGVVGTAKPNIPVTNGVARNAGYVFDQNKQQQQQQQQQQPVQGAIKPAIQVIASNSNSNINNVNTNNNNNRFYQVGGEAVVNNEFPRLSNRKQNKVKVDNNDNLNNDDDVNNNVNNNKNTNNDNGVKSNDDNNSQGFNVNNNNFHDESKNNNNNVFNNNNARNNQNGESVYNVNRANNVNGGNNNNNDYINNNNNVPNRPDIPPMGGININWDWEDFSIMFDNYGGAEMKVRRAPHASTGEPWPMPQYYSKKDNKVYKISRDLRFVPTGHTCDILDEAMVRHLQRVLRGSVEDMYDNLQNAEGSNIPDPSLKYEKEEYLKAPIVNRVELRLRKACAKYPSLEMDESYDLVVKKKKTFIYANEVWGVLRGLETLGQLVWRGTDGFLYIKETVISDYPRFPHRGLHIDTSRHFLFKEVLLDIMDSMEMNKLNVFHWHIVDDQSFPYESKVYPELSRKGAYHPTYVYSLEDIAELVEYGRLRGIRVMPEFDTPGHTYSWGLSRPELLTQCFSGSTPVKGYLGPMDPSKNSTYRFLTTLFQEVMDVFKDQFLHLGGDEVPLGCWQSNPEVMAFANELNRKHQENMAKQPSLTQQQQQQQSYNNYGGSWSMWSEEIKRVYEYYENRLIKLLNDLGKKRKSGVRYIMWQEVMNNNLQLPNDTIIQVWMGDMGDVMRATSLGYNVLYSTCWYLDHIEYGTKWPKYYQCDPVDQSYGYHIDEKKVLGGEVAFWSEYFSNENLIPLMWPRASAAAERLWSNKEVKNLDKAAVRLSEHRCRMIKRGINAGEISGPGYCLHSPPKRRLFNDTIGCKGGNCSRLHNFVEIEDIQVHVSQRGGGLSECGNVFSRGDTGVLVLLILICLLILFMVTITRSSSRLGRMRHCKNKSILLVFVLLLLVYFLCYTTIGLRAFEFSGSIHKTFQEDKRGHGKDGGGMGGLDGFQDGKRLMS